VSRNIAILRVHKTIAGERANTIRAWLQRRGVKPLTFLVRLEGEEFVVAIGFASPVDSQALVEELGGEITDG
jgi:hypothetical protein